jgi:hypothetical protein
MSLEFYGRFGDLVLLKGQESSVVINEKTKNTERVGLITSLVASASWEKSEVQPSKSVFEIAEASITNLDVEVLSDSKRLYTIPKGVSSEAKRGLEWRKEFKRGGTDVGTNTARTLAKGGQIGIEKVRHIAKYFPRHEVDKKGKGYKPGQDSYPSAGRIAWALWGGDAGQRWASAIVERENKKKSEASTFSHYEAPKRIDYSSLSEPREGGFFIRIRLDGSGIDRLYRVDNEGECRVWDDSQWDDLGNIAHDFLTYDKTLDDPYDQIKKIHVPVDQKSAILIAAFFDSNPFEPVGVSRLNEEESDLFSRAAPEEDWAFLDMLSSEEIEDVDYFDDEDGLTAAGEPVTDQDGNYTPEERSAKAQAQPRDASGQFAKTGSTVVVGGNPAYTGKITSINPDTQEVNIRLANDETVAVPASMTQEISTFEPVSTADFPESSLDFSGILGEPRVPIDQPTAQLPGRLPPLTAADTNLLVSDWGSWVRDQRLAPEYDGDPVKPFVPKKLPDPNSVLGEYYKGAFKPDGTPKDTWNPATAPNVYNEPMLRDWLDKKYSNKSGEVGYHNRGWYRPKPAGVPIEEKKSREEVYSRENINRLDDKYNRVNFSIVAAAEEESLESKTLTPENSDVAPMYMAIVDKNDPQAVLALVSLIPADNKTGEAATFKREPGKWVPDNSIINDLNSPTPPPVIVLGNEDLAAVLKQIDGETIIGSAGDFNPAIVLSNNAKLTALVAKGGLDRNRGNAARLRRYWTIGPGALKIRWNTPGDWTRCYRQLAKHMGPRAKGYCSLRHKEMTGTWPGSKRNIGRRKKRVTSIADSLIASVRPEEAVINEFTLRARAESAKSRFHGGRAYTTPKNHGAKFIIPLVIPEDMESGDGRVFQKDSISFRDLPLPLLWQIKTGQGHDGSVVVGQILSMEKTGQGIGNAYGVFDSGKMGQEAERLVRHGFIRGVSADMDQFEADEEEIEIPEAGDDSDESKKIGGGRINITKARVMAVTIVPKPAFQECFIQIIEEDTAAQEEEVVPDGTYVDGIDDLDAAALVACGMVAGAIPVEPPKSWFEKPLLQGATPLTITDDGRVFGHIAAWHVDHIGMSFGTKPPRSRSNYAYFHTGSLKTAEGEFVPVGQLTLAGGHAGLEASADEAVRHYDDTASAFADVHAGEDAFGIWVSGSLRPGTTPEQVRAARASAPSGDWRPIKGRLELVAVCQVNVPGFPIARARVASGQVMALVAAGAKVLAQMKSDPLAELSQKVARLEAAQNEPIVAAAEAAKSRVAAVILENKRAELSAKVKKTKTNTDINDDYMNQMFDDDPENEMSVISRRVRERLAKEGKALDDGSYPIRNVSDLKNAVRAYGRAKPGKRAKVKKHIIRRAKGLSRSDLVPEKWRNASTEEYSNFSFQERVKEARQKLALEVALTAAAEADEDLKDLTPEELEALKQEARASKEKERSGVPKFTPETQPRDERGKFRKVLARLKADLGDAGLQRVVEKVEEAENLDFGGNYEQAAKSANELIEMIDRLDAGALNPESIENVRAGSEELGKVIANLPFAFGQQTEKIRFSDVPPALRDLIKDMIERVYDRLGDKEDADIATQELKAFMSGSDYYSQSDISSQMSKLLRLLT